jgi:hypothetical protein
MSKKTAEQFDAEAGRWSERFFALKSRHEALIAALREIACHPPTGSAYQIITSMSDRAINAIEHDERAAHNTGTGHE